MTMKQETSWSEKLESRRQLLRQAALDSTAHGMSRVASNRHWVVRLLWLAAFLAMIGLLLQQLNVSLQKLRGKPVSTSLEPSSVDFAFPDVHVCSYPMVSASYSATMNASARNFSQQQMDAIVRLLKLAGVASNDELLRLAGLAFVGTVPYSFLSSHFGMRIEQSVIGAVVMPVTINLQQGVDITGLSHYKFLNCFTIRINNATLYGLVSNVIGYLDLSLYADASYNQTMRLNNNTIDVRAFKLYNYEFLLGSGFRLYFTERGKFPDDYSASVAVSPGFHHHISLSMVKSSLTVDKQQCVTGMGDANILDQVTGKPVAYAYSLGVCYARVLYSSLTNSMRCFIPGFFPQMYDFKDLPNCNNLTDVIAAYNSNASASPNLMQINLMRSIYNGSMAKDMADAVTSMQDNCQFQKPCEEVIYQPVVTSVLFPLKQGLTEELSTIFKLLTQKKIDDGYSLPGRSWMASLFDAVYTNGTVNSTAMAELVSYASENVLRIRLQAGELSSTRLSQDVSYKLQDLTAGVGGLMGLFMGGSVLTLLELVEILAFLLVGRRITSSGSAVDADQASSPGNQGAGSSAGPTVRTVF